MSSCQRTSRLAARPRLETLESRRLLYATFGDMWAYGSRITYSFEPDGTDLGGYPSNMFSALAAEGISNSQVELQFEKAAAVWQSVTNINLTQVSDNGAGMGSAGAQQDDPNFGDIRIGGENLGNSGTLAVCFLPPKANGGSLAGDIVLNTAQSWGVNTNVDLETVAIHEIGHALGMAHSAIQSADMFAYYEGTKQSLTSDDTAGIQSIYGTRQADSFDSVASNNSLATASNINSYMNSQGQISLGGPNGTGSPVTLDLQANTDYDYYTVTAPTNTTGTLTVTMQSDNLSSLDPKVLLYNSANQVLGTATAPASYGGTVTITVSGVTAGQKFTIKCMAADSGPSGTGGYGLLVNFGSGTQSPVAPPNTYVAAQADQGGGSSNEEGGGSSNDGKGGLSDDVLGPLTVGAVTGIGDDLTILNPAKYERHRAFPAVKTEVSVPKARKLTSHRVTVVALHPRQVISR